MPDDKALRRWSLLSDLQQAIAASGPLTPTGNFGHDDTPTVADICLVTQSDAGAVCSRPISSPPRVMRTYDACMAIPAFAEAHPRKLPDFDGH
jgi:glutathione S-transferase